MKLLRISVFSWAFLGFLSSFGQNNNGVIDELGELFKKETIQMVTPDGAKLATDVFLPITSDSLTINIDIPLLGSINLEIIPKGVQYIKYPEVNGQVNPNPFQLPMMLTRTPYGKNDVEVLGYIFAALGYAVILQDTRGMFESSDLFLPLYTDSWDKTVYSDYVPEAVLPDGYDPDGTRNISSYEDGTYTLRYLLEDLRRPYDLDEDGIADTTDLVGNGSIFYFGASALSNSGLQMALASKTHPDQPGMKGYMNLIASELYWGHVLFQNGVYKQALISDWVRAQLRNFDENHEVFDTTWTNAIHTPSDYGLNSIDELLDHMMTLVSDERVDDKAGVYPNGSFRKAYDATRAPVDEHGQGDPTGAYNRFGNMDMPFYHISGWWDIFMTGQIETWKLTRKHISEAHGNRQKQKLVIGPWQHYYPALRNAGDLSFPANVADVLGVTANFTGEVDFELLLSILQLDLDAFLNTELFSFIRYAANYNSFKNIGEPDIRLPANLRYQKFTNNFLVQVPAEEYAVTHADLLNWITGLRGLDGVVAKVYRKTPSDTILVNTVELDLPPLPPLLTNVFGDLEEPLESFPAYHDFATLPDVRMYIVGPVDDGVPGNNRVGNYWIEADTFPLVDGRQWNELFLHSDGSLRPTAPDSMQSARTYVHDPLNPVRTVAGNNLNIDAPNGDLAMGPINLAKPEHIQVTMDHPGVIAFETAPLEDSLTVIGYPVVTLYASSLPEGASPGDLTDTDFMVRIVDHYPNGGQYQITEGTISARAREYVKTVAEGREDDDAPFSNIESDVVYEFKFPIMPLGYTFGKQHRLKILISSANYPRYQSNPNIPIEENQFFRWKPGDTETHTFQGTEYSPRSASNSVHFSPEHASSLTLPVFGRQIAECGTVAELSVSGISDSTATLHWSPASGTARYMLRYRPLGTDEWTEAGPMPGYSYTAEGLSSGTAYEWQAGSLCEEETLYALTDTFESTGVPTAVDQVLLGALEVYPNPASGPLLVRLNGLTWKGTIRLVDLSGKAVRQWTAVLGGDRHILDTGGLPPGSYILEFNSGKRGRAALPVILLGD